MRHAGWNVDARSFGAVKDFVANLELRAAIENVKCLVRLDVIMRARLEAGLAVFFHHLERLVGVAAGNLHDHFVGLGVDVAFARRRMLALICHVSLPRLFLRSYSAGRLACGGWKRNNIRAVCPTGDKFSQKYFSVWAAQSPLTVSGSRNIFLSPLRRGRFMRRREAGEEAVAARGCKHARPP